MLNLLQRRVEQLLACLMSLPDLNSAQVDALVHLAVVLQKVSWLFEFCQKSFVYLVVLNFEKFCYVLINFARN